MCIDLFPLEDIVPALRVTQLVQPLDNDTKDRTKEVIRLERL